MTIFDAHGVLTFRARHRIRESLKGGGGILYYLYLSSNLRNLEVRFSETQHYFAPLNQFIK